MGFRKIMPCKRKNFITFPQKNEFIEFIPKEIAKLLASVLAETKRCFKPGKASRLRRATNWQLTWAS